MPRYNIANGSLTRQRRTGAAVDLIAPRVGRPRVTNRATGDRYQVYLLPEQVAALRALGDGSLSAGIVAALAK